MLLASGVSTTSRPEGCINLLESVFVPRSRSGFALILSVVLVLVASTGVLLWFQQAIRSRFQSEAFLENQRLFHDMQVAVQVSTTSLQSRTANDLQSEQTVDDALAPVLPGWTGMSEPAQNDLLLTLRPPPKTGTFALEALLRIKPLELSVIPWVLFQPADPHVPTWLELDSTELAATSANRSRRWLAETSAGISPDHTFPHGSQIVWQSTQFSVTFADGTTQTYSLSGQPLTLRTEGDLLWEMDFRQAGVPWLWVDVAGNLTLRLPSSSSQHLSATPVAFVNVGGDLKLQRQAGGFGAGQVGGFFRMLGDSCAEMSSGLTVYWTGSLACETYRDGAGQIRLRSGSAPSSVPEPFVRNVLQPDGVRIIED